MRRETAADVKPPLPRKPDWLKVRISQTKTFHNVRDLVKGLHLHTVCEEAACPNRGECWNRGTATILIMGDICTRSCGFCNVKTGKPLPLDLGEPRRVAEAVQTLHLHYAVITSVDRDELSDGGAGHFAATIRSIHELNPQCKVEALIPDFKGMEVSLTVVCDARPEVLAHNLETVARLHSTVRPQAKYWRSLQLLGRAKKQGMVVKSGIMVGLGETKDEVIEVMRDLVDVGCDLLTIGQYMQPTPKHLPVVEYIHPDVFKEYEEIGRNLGLAHVQSGALVRSSYLADLQEAIIRSEER
ncbi:lipoyl synthase [candidate division KSB1 bacterium]|nr:MAG: lipoyl synthase [candidate division KSB1 bacterium]